MSPCNARISHVTFLVRDLAKMEQFYAEVLNLRVSGKGRSRNFGGDMVFLKGNDEAHHQVAMMSSDVAGTEPQRIHHVAFMFDTLDELRGVCKRAVANGGSGMRMVDHGITWSVYIADPEGNTLELMVQTPFYVPQPFARPYDLSLSDAELMADTEESSRQVGGFMLRAEWEREFSYI